MSEAEVLPANVRVLTELSQTDDGFDISDERAMKRLALAEERHYWHVSRNELIAAGLARLGVKAPSRVLDLGCGGGCVTAHLAKVGYDVVGVDGHGPRVREAAVRAPRATFFVHDLRRGVSALPSGFRAVGLFDVLEHLDEPRAALEQALSLVAPGGVVVGTVPALQSLWSVVDEVAGHRLRYDRRTLTELLSQLPSARREEVRYFNALLVPAIWLRRKAVASAVSSRLEEDLDVPPAPANALFTALLRADHRLAGTYTKLRLPGASLWFAVRRSS